MIVHVDLSQPRSLRIRLYYYGFSPFNNFIVAYTICKYVLLTASGTAAIAAITCPSDQSGTTFIKKYIKSKVASSTGSVMGGVAAWGTTIMSDTQIVDMVLFKVARCKLPTDDHLRFVGAFNRWFLLQ